MHPPAGPIAHALLGPDLRIIDADDSYGALFGFPRAMCLGKSALDFLHPDDRPGADVFLRRAWEKGLSFSATQRQRHADGRTFWVHFSVSRLGTGERQCLVVTCRPLPDAREGRPSTVEAQWQVARLLLQALNAGKRSFGDALIGSPATEILLVGYVAEAESRPITAGEIADRITIPWSLSHRWLAALIDAGFIEQEIAGPIGLDTPIRLSVRSLGMLETIFGALVAIVQGQLAPA